MDDSFIIAVDLGGSNIKAGLVSQSGDIVDFVHEPSLASLGFNQSRKKLLEVIDRLNRKQSGVTGVGIGVAGIVDVASSL